MRRTKYTIHNQSSDRSERSRTGAGIDTPDTPKALNDVSNTSRSVVLDRVYLNYLDTPKILTELLKWKAS